MFRFYVMGWLLVTLLLGRAFSQGGEPFEYKLAGKTLLETCAAYYQYVETYSGTLDDKMIFTKDISAWLPDSLGLLKGNYVGPLDGEVTVIELNLLENKLIRNGTLNYQVEVAVIDGSMSVRSGMLKLKDLPVFNGHFQWGKTKSLNASTAQFVKWNTPSGTDYGILTTDTKKLNYTLLRLVK